MVVFLNTFIVKGNMELLARYGTPSQKQRWLKPLLEGDIRSCFGMTEPDVASSDALNLSTRIDRDGDRFVINGRKWWTSGAMDPRCKLMLLLGRGPQSIENGIKGSEQKRHRQHSVVLIPMNSTGLKVERFLTVFGYDDAPHGHAEVTLANVTVGASDGLLHVEGGGFEAAQSRLGGGRLHHCMRLVGLAERAQDLLVARASTRETFGKTLIWNDAVIQVTGQNRCDIETMRAVVRSTARTVDTGNEKEIRKSVGVAKVVVPRLACKVVDRAIQIHGGLGVCQDTLLGMLYAQARSLQIADGPDEVHLQNVAKYDAKSWRSRAKL